MGPRLFPATQARNIIERMVRTGAISGPKAEAWSKKFADEEKVKETRAKAESGDTKAMCKVGTWCEEGSMGLAKDLQQATGWYRRGHNLGDPTCTTCLGFRYEDADNPEIYPYAAHLYTAATAGGSMLGCYYLATSFTGGGVGLQQNHRKATRWYRAMQSASVHDLSDDEDDMNEQAVDWLRKNAVSDDDDLDDDDDSS